VGQREIGNARKDARERKWERRKRAWREDARLRYSDQASEDARLRYSNEASEDARVRYSNQASDMRYSNQASDSKR